MVLLGIERRKRREVSFPGHMSHTKWMFFKQSTSLALFHFQAVLPEQDNGKV